MAKEKCAIFDLDGTICDHQHRRHFVVNKPKNYKAFHDACLEDTPHQYVLDLLTIVSARYAIVLCSGRPDSHRFMTEKWLEYYHIRYNTLYMRKAGDTRADAIVKKEMLDQIRNFWNPVFAVDDRPSVLFMWRKNGVPAFAVDQSDWVNHSTETAYLCLS